MQRRIQQTDCNRFAVHRSKDPFKVGSLVRQQFQDRSVTVFVRFGQNESSYVGDAITFEEHVLGSAKSDSLSPERQSSFGVFGRVGVGANIDLAILIRPPRHGFVHLVDPVILSFSVSFDQSGNHG